MARSSRSSAVKANNQRLAAGVFGPIEAARAERLSARLLEVARQPKPQSSDTNMGETNDADKAKDSQDKSKTGDDAVMDLDSSYKPAKSSVGRKRIEKRRKKTAGIVFPKYGDMIAKKKKAATKTK
ncbi:Protein of unknown function (DUF2423) [Geosmithia morbida]|uniref:DUF2423 domain-containing protein n=1 Tax=Geosmithia morbida TaxID=1094350 RepID=A0A9P4YNN3_9HYPO|nr:Protein of unknown function (DUF2423) [Geosmithia morbida]KAF4120291.1 Protein of unknown function (DUF2423) [Geosmithia morbida]